MKVQSGRIGRWWASMGKRPACFGHHRPAHPDCDGLPPCSFRPPCRAFQSFIREAQGDGGIERALDLLHPDQQAVLSWFLLQDPAGRRADADAPRHRMAWQRFGEAFKAGLPPGTDILPNREIAVPGELYSKVWHARTGRSHNMRRMTVPIVWTIGLRGHGEPCNDAPICRFWPRPFAVVEPTIEWRAKLADVLAMYPEVKPRARRWYSWAKWGWREEYSQSLIHCRAQRVFPEYIEDMARLIAKMLRENALTALSWPPDAAAMASARGREVGRVRREKQAAAVKELA